jgi:hypothetical protein
MDPDPFQAMLDDSRRSKDDLVTIRENTLRQNDLARVHAVEAVLDRQFPNWRVIRTRRGGPEATDVEFKGRTAHFNTQKDAYIWLLERFIQAYPKPFEEMSRDTVFIAKGPRALFFAKSLEQLFGDEHQDLASDSTKWRQLSNGWYAKLVLSEVQKRELLTKFATVARWRFGIDWDWNGKGRANPEPSTDELLRRFDDLSNTRTVDSTKG